MTTPSAPANAEKTKAEKPEKADADAPEKPEGKNKSQLPESQRPPGDLRRRTKKDKREGPFVKYVGAAALRRITSAQWKSLDIDLHDEGSTTEWTVGNDKLVEMSKFTDAQLDYLLIDDLQQGTNTHAFLLVDYDDEGQLVQVPYE